MNELLLNPITKKQVEAFIASPSNSLLLQGENGHSSKLALKLCAEIIGQKLNAANTLVVEAKSKSISIDDIREIKAYLKLKHSKTGAISRAVVINAAELMTLEAQNAILKILEEPPKDTLIVLSAGNARSLLGTIVSRCSIIRVLPVPLDAALAFYRNQGFNETTIKKNYFLSDGNGELLDTLIKGTGDSLQSKSIETAKSILKNPVHKRLEAINTLLKDEANFEPTVIAISTILHSVLQQQLIAQKTVSKLLLDKISATEEAIEALAFTPNKKLLLTNLFLNI